MKSPKVHWAYKKTKAAKNFVLEGRSFYISYNPSALFSKTPETALYVKNTGEWLILNGDWREEYEKAYPILANCRKVYNRNIAHRSKWSTV